MAYAKKKKTPRPLPKRGSRTATNKATRKKAY